jgi:phage gp29-like protein
MPKRPDLAEIGTTGLRRTGGTVYEEFLVSLRGRRGAKVYREMSENDPVVGSIIYAIEKIILRLDWTITPSSDKEEDRETAEFIEQCLYDMSDSWDSTLSSILSMLVYGYAFHEIVYKIRGGAATDDPTKRSNFDDGKIGWRKWPVRAQETHNNWMFDQDGGIQGFEQVDPYGAGIHRIPIDKGLLFRTTTHKNNPEGKSLLRTAYRPWYFKRRIEEMEAIGIERDLAGLPIAYLPPEYLSSQATAEQLAVRDSIVSIVQNVKRNEQEGIVFPLVFDDRGNKMFSIELLSSGGSRQFDTDKVISRYDQRIAMSVLSDFILLGHERVGSFALGSSKIDLWTMAVEAICKSIAEVINYHAIPRLLKLNGMKLGSTPELTYSDVSHIDLGEISDYVAKLVTAGVIKPDDDMEEYLRGLAGLPMGEQKDNDLFSPETEEPEADRGDEEPEADTSEPDKKEPYDGDDD